ncbi:MAG: tetratricopeptide repeat protein, partial [Bryobacteraceae bacterium]
NHLIATMAWTRKGQLLLKKGLKEEALSACRRAVEAAAALPPKEVNRLAALINLGVALWRNNKVEEALDTLREPTRLWSELPGEVPNRALGWWMIGEILETQERREEALQAYERGAAVEPSSHAIQFSKGHVLYELEDYESAEKSCQRAWDCANAPQEKFDALVLRGFAQSKQEHYEDAIRSYREAVALLPGEFSREWKLWVGLGEAYQASGRSGAALRAFQQGWRRDPRGKKSSALAVAISGAMLDLKQDDKALEFLEKEAVESAKEDPSGRLAFNYGVALYRAKRKTLARIQWKEAAAKGFPAAKDFLEKLEKGGSSTSAWLEYWFGDVTPAKRRAVGALLAAGALVVALLPMVKRDVIPWLNTGQDWNVMALTVAAFLALLALPVVGSLSLGPLKLDGVRSEASPGGGGAVDEELDKAIRSGVSSLATAGTGAGRSLQAPNPRIGPGGLGG